MSLESRIEARGRRLLRSPLWVGLAITAFLVVPTFLVPSVPLWVALVSLVTLAPLVLLGTYSLYYLYGWLSNVPGTDEDDAATSDSAFETPIDRLRHRYATGEIDEATFERKLDRLLETETLQRRDGPERERDLLKE